MNRGIGSYNGWSAQERRATIPIQLEAFRSGLIMRPTECSICGCDQPRQPSEIMLHNERYDRPLEGYGCCKRCHAVLHMRFDDPARWLRLLDRVGHTGWARHLSLDPASQWRQFSETYPEGLPYKC